MGGSSVDVHIYDPGPLADAAIALGLDSIVIGIAAAAAVAMGKGPGRTGNGIGNTGLPREGGAGGLFDFIRQRTLDRGPANRVALAGIDRAAGICQSWRSQDNTGDGSEVGYETLEAVAAGVGITDPPPVLGVRFQGGNDGPGRTNRPSGGPHERFALGVAVHLYITQVVDGGRADRSIAGWASRRRPPLQMRDRWETGFRWEPDRRVVLKEPFTHSLSPQALLERDAPIIGGVKGQVGRDRPLTGR